MPQSIGIGLGCLLDSTDANHQPLSSSNTTVVSVPESLRFAVSSSMQIVTDGGAVVNWAVQVTNFSGNFGRAVNNKILGNVFARDDSYASNMWSTVASGVLAKNVGTLQGALMTLGVCAHHDARVILQYDPGNTGGATANYFVCARTSGT